MTLTEKKKILNKLVREEAEKLRSKLTKTEKNKLDFTKLNPTDTERCIYGQATGDCFSERAKKLILACATKVYDADYCTPYNALSTKSNKLGEKPTKNRKRDDYFSPIEVFTYKRENRRNGNNTALVRYIKEETKTLRLK